MHSKLGSEKLVTTRKSQQVVVTVGSCWCHVKIMLPSPPPHPCVGRQEMCMRRQAGNMYMHMYACMYMHMYACMYMHAYVCMHACTCMHMYACMQIHACMHTHACTCMHVQPGLVPLNASLVPRQGNKTSTRCPPNREHAMENQRSGANEVVPHSGHHSARDL